MSEPTHSSREKPDGPAIVALGGGHGLFATLQAVRRLTVDVTAVVTVADDGGSSGRLRAELGVIPPGDLRMALAALASDEPEIVDWTDLPVICVNLSVSVQVFINIFPVGINS